MAFLSIILISCSKVKDSYVVSVDHKELQFSLREKEKELKIISSGEWHIQADGIDYFYGGNAGYTDWYKISPVSGMNNATVVIMLKEEIVIPSPKISALKIIGKNNVEFVTLKYSDD